MTAMYTVIHAIAGYLFLLLTVRVMARRPGAQLTPFEFVIIFLIGGVIIRATVGNDQSETNCTCAIMAIGLVHRLMSILRGRSAKFRRWIDGVPMLLLRNGEWQLEAMRGLRVDPDDVMAAARQQGVRNLSEIDYAVIERNGSITVMKH